MYKQISEFTFSSITEELSTWLTFREYLIPFQHLYNPNGTIVIFQILHSKARNFSLLYFYLYWDV